MNLKHRHHRLFLLSIILTGWLNSGHECLMAAEPGSPHDTQVIDDRGTATADIRVRHEGDMAWVQRLGLEISAQAHYAPGWLILRARDPLAAKACLAALMASDQVTEAAILHARWRYPRTMPNDPLISKQWQFNPSNSAPAGADTQIENVWNYPSGPGLRGAGIRIGIVDDGIETHHEDLAPNLDSLNGWDWNGDDNDPSAESGDDHGSACAGLAGARGNNGLGICGAAPESKLVGLRLIAGAVTDQQEAEAMAWKNNLIQIKSNSWGPNDSGSLLEAPGPLTRAALETASTDGRGGKGTIFVWAAGNGGDSGDNSNYDGYANSIYTIAVGAVDRLGNSPTYSERGANVMICAPAGDSPASLGVTTTDLIGSKGYNSSPSALGGDYSHDFEGTSSATPVVAGIVALMLEANPQLGWRDVQEILIRSALRFRPDHVTWTANAAGISFHPSLGAGAIDAEAAVTMADGWQNLGEQTQVIQRATNLNQPIPDNDSTGITRELEITSTGIRCEHVTIKVNIIHSARGNLEIELISPSGTRNRLSELHVDTNNHYSNWTFSSVRNWGEDAGGTWKLKVTDRSSLGNTLGGTLNSVELTVYGAPFVPQNPPPQVTLLSPENDSVFSPGTLLNVEASVTDLTADGTPGEVISVTLLDNDNPVTTLNSPPFLFSYTPGNGAHQLIARATDSQGAQGESTALGITVANQAPRILVAGLNAIAQAYSDRDLKVLLVESSDPEGDPVSINYQWQSSADGLSYQNATSEIQASLPADAARSGRLWRCQITGSDSEGQSDPYFTEAVNLLARPGISADAGTFYSYSSGLVLASAPLEIEANALINEFNLGPSGTVSQWIEILTLKHSNLGFWDLGDNSQLLVFSESGVWTDIPAGTLVVIYNGAAPKDGLLPPDDFDPSDGQMVVPSTHSSYFLQNFDSWTTLAEQGDSLALNDPDSVTVHALSYGVDHSKTLYIGQLGAGMGGFFSGSSEAKSLDPGEWKISPTAGIPTPAQANGPANAGLIAKLRNPSTKFRLGADTTLPSGLSLDSDSGLLSGTLAPENAPGRYPITIERFNTAGDQISQSFVLSVGVAAGYLGWIAEFDGLTEDSPEDDPDIDQVVNLLEYALDSKADEFGSAFSLVADSDGLSLIFRRSKFHGDVELLAEWSKHLGDAANWRADGLLLQQISEDASTRTLKATLADDPTDPRRFLRLRAFLLP